MARKKPPARMTTYGNTAHRLSLSSYFLREVMKLTKVQVIRRYPFLLRGSGVLEEYRKQQI